MIHESASPALVAEVVSLDEINLDTTEALSDAGGDSFFGDSFFWPLAFTIGLAVLVPLAFLHGRVQGKKISLHAPPTTVDSATSPVQPSCEPANHHHDAAPALHEELLATVQEDVPVPAPAPSPPSSPPARESAPAPAPAPAPEPAPAPAERRPHPSPVQRPRALAPSPGRAPLQALSTRPDPAVVPQAGGAPSWNAPTGRLTLQQQMDARRDRAVAGASSRRPASSPASVASRSPKSRSPKYGSLQASPRRVPSNPELPSPRLPCIHSGRLSDDESSSEDEGDKSFGRGSPKSYKRWVEASSAGSSFNNGSWDRRTADGGSSFTSGGGSRSTDGSDATVASSASSLHSVLAASLVQQPTRHALAASDCTSLPSAGDHGGERTPRSDDLGTPLSHASTALELGVTAASGWGVLERASRDQSREGDRPTMYLRKRGVPVPEIR